jgi:lipoic acid synthetase
MQSLGKPDWLRVKIPSGRSYSKIREVMNYYGLHTVCEEAHCPNIGECWGGGTATFMIMGDTCTRACRFCAVDSGRPEGFLDPFEPDRVAKAVQKLDFDYVVITSVCRDDLSDGGAAHFAETVEEVKKGSPDIRVEVLIPDFHGSERDIRTMVEAEPDVIAHNLETVKRLTPRIRDPRATYTQSLRVLNSVKEINGDMVTKSSLMLGLGETEDEVFEAMDDLRGVDTDILTLGQYLRPSHKHIQLERFVNPQKFREFKHVGEEKGFALVISGPLVRSSYRAGEFFIRRFLDERRPRQKAAGVLAE